MLPGDVEDKCDGLVAMQNTCPVYDDVTSSTTCSEVYASPAKKKRYSVVQEQRSSKSAVKPLIIFDYDDTILPTSYLNRRGLKLGSVDDKEELDRVRSVLDEYSVVVNKTLTMARRIGHVLIVTNAEEGWISLTVKKFLPKSANLIDQFQHISARSIFEPTGLFTPISWKHSAFRMVVEEYLGAAAGLSGSSEDSATTNYPQVISLGDSAHEREAILKVSKDFANQITVKSLKFMEKPDLESLKKEHLLIQECLSDIVKHCDSLDLCIQAIA
jgi:hypothetical protein